MKKHILLTSIPMRFGFGVIFAFTLLIGMLLQFFGGIWVDLGFSLAAVSLTCCYLGIMFKFLNKTGVLDYCKGILKKFDVAFLFAIGVLTALFVLIFLLLEDYVYFWDYGSYWVKSLDVAKAMRTDFGTALFDAFIVSVNKSEYNDFICAIMVAPLLLGGRTYVGFYFFVCVLFYLPAVFVIAVTIRKFVAADGYGSYVSVGAICLIVLLVGIGIVPILNGYADAFCLLPISILFYTAFERRFRIFNRTDAVVTSVCLLTVALGRRYYLYFLVGFVASVVFVNTFDILSRKIRGVDAKKEFFGFVRNMLTIGGICLFCLCTIFSGFTKMSLFGNYSDAYQAYGLGSVARNLINTLKMCGVLPCVFAVIGIFALLIMKKYYVLSFLSLSSVLGGVLFSTVQTTGQQHLYILYFQLAALDAAGAFGIVVLMSKIGLALETRFSTVDRGVFVKSALLRRGIMSRVGVSLAALAMSFNFLCVTILGDTSFAGFWTDSRAECKIRNDMETLNELTDYLYENVVGGRTIYCLGSGEVFNFDVLNKLSMPNKSKIADNLLSVPQVDLRDGFSASFLYADFIVTESPCELHLGESNQRVVSVLNRAVMGGSSLNDNLRKGDSFILDKGIVVTVWERISPYDAADLAYLVGEFDKYYTDRPDLFRNRILAEMK